ncbi:MAG: LCP family protein [Micromonosporaceae bacterium]
MGRHRPMPYDTPVSTPGGPPKAPLWARLCVWFGAILMFASGGVLVGGNLLLANLSSNVGTDNLLGGARKSNNGRVSLDGPINMLLLGTDRRKGWSSWQSDTIMMVHVPESHDRAYLISFQRDTLVDIPAFKKAGFNGGQDKLNAAFSYGGRNPNGGKFSVAHGFELMARTIQNFSGIQFDTGATIDFEGFLRTVKLLGGVKMCVETPSGKKTFQSIHPPKRIFKKGCQELSPAEALDYSRQRYQFVDEPGGGDFARMRHQQQLIKAILKRAIETGFANPTKIPSLVKAAGKSLLLDQSIPVAQLGWTLRKIKPDSLTAIEVPVMAASVDRTSYQKLVPKKSASLFEAIKEEKLDAWTLKHPDAINPM